VISSCFKECALVGWVTFASIRLKAPPLLLHFELLGYMITHRSDAYDRRNEL